MEKNVLRASNTIITNNVGEMIITIYTKMVINVHEICSLRYIKGKENKMMKLRILIGFNNILITA